MVDALCRMMAVLMCTALLASCSLVLKSKHDTNEHGIPYHLPKSLVHLEVERIVQGSNIDYKVTAKPVLAPDLNTRFILQHQESPLSSDRICVSRTTMGLLESVQFATDDMTDEIMIKLSELGAKVAKTAATGGATLRSEQPQLKSVKAMAIGDPENKQSLLDQIKPIIDELTSINFPGIIPNPNTRTCDEESICFSTLTVTPVVLTFALPDGSTSNSAATVSLVDYSHVGKLSLRRPFLAERIAKIGFSDGILTSMAIKQPSEGLALASLPLQIADTVLGVPANFFSKAFSGIFNDQKALLEQQKELATLQKDIRDKQPTPTDVTQAKETDSSFKLECVSLAKSQAK